jgi:hypothetical protein
VNEDVVEAAGHWLAAFELPGAREGVKDLAGRTVVVSSLTDEETVRFFFPRRSLLFHQGVVKKLTGALRKRGAKIERRPITPEDFVRWRSVGGHSDTPEQRFRFASVPPTF